MMVIGINSAPTGGTSQPRPQAPPKLGLPQSSAAATTLPYSNPFSVQPCLKQMPQVNGNVKVEVPLREVHGRQLNSLNESYMLPADATEHKRLDLQHDMLTARMGGLFLCPDVVERALAPRENSQPAVLDVGTGSGSWAIGVAQMFPHANVVGLDLAPVNPISPPPPNCRFECGDVNEDLSRFYNSFDVVHARAIIQGIRDYRVFLREVVKMLRPGGVFISLEAQFELFDADRNPIGAQVFGDPNFSWMHKLLTSAGRAMIARNPGLPEVERIAERLAECGNVWEEISSTVLYTPIGAWDQNMSQTERRVGELMARNCFGFADAARPLLHSLGEPPKVVDLWIRNTQAELTEAKVKQYGRWPGVWAIKKSINHV